MVSDLPTRTRSLNPTPRPISFPFRYLLGLFVWETTKQPVSTNRKLKGPGIPQNGGGEGGRCKGRHCEALGSPLWEFQNPRGSPPPPSCQARPRRKSKDPAPELYVEARLGPVFREVGAGCLLSPHSGLVDCRNGCGPKLKNWGFADFSLWFHLPRHHFGTCF